MKDRAVQSMMAIQHNTSFENVEVEFIAAADAKYEFNVKVKKPGKNKPEIYKVFIESLSTNIS